MTHTGDLGVDLLSVAGHKLYGPKGVGALFVREHARLEPLIHGASHELADAVELKMSCSTSA